MAPASQILIYSTPLPDDMKDLEPTVPFTGNDMEYLTEAEERFHFFKYQRRLRYEKPPVHEGPLIKRHWVRSSDTERTGPKPSPPKVDWVTRHVMQALDGYSGKSFYNLLKGLKVHACSSFVPKQRQTYSEIKNAAFEVIGYHQEVVVPISLKRDDTGKHHIIVYLNGSWQRLECFLDTLHPSQSVLDDLSWRNHVHMSFWNRNQQSFRLLDLPREIRDIVYGFALGLSIEPRSYPPEDKYERQPTKYVDYKEFHAPNRPLLRTCKQVCREALYVLSHHAEFEFKKLGWINAFFTRKRPLFPKVQKKLEKQGMFSVRPNIKYLKLSFSHDQFLKFFGAQLGNKKIWRLSPAAAGLQNLKLNTLELNIQHPYSMHTCEWLYDGCHETVVEWILEAAFPYIKHLPVRLTGCVKTSTRAIFRERLEKAHQGDDAGVLLALDPRDSKEDLVIDNLRGHDGKKMRVLRPVIPVKKL